MTTYLASAPLIQLRDVTKIYRMGNIDVAALRGVNVTVRQGEMVAIMGPSGSGKSTMMNVLGCLDVPTSGTYLLEGQDIGKLSDDRLAEIRGHKIGFVFQQYNLLPRLTALANVEQPLMYSNDKNGRARSLEALDRVGLAARVHHRPKELSGGEQQRVGIARALVKHPAILMADEPTGNLDSKSSIEIMGILQRLNTQEGITVIIVTHEPEVAAQTRRVISMRDGSVVRDAAVDQPVWPHVPSPVAGPTARRGESG